MIATTLGKVVIARWRGIDWLLNDEFSDARAAGSVNGTYGDFGPQATRTVVDTESKLSISGGNLVFAGGKAAPAWGNPAIRYPAITRTVGRGLIIQWQGNTFAKQVIAGFTTSDNLSLTASMKAGAYLDSASNLGLWNGAINNGGKPAVYGSMIPIAIYLRASGAFLFAKPAGIWKLYWVSPTDATATLYPFIVNYDQVLSANFLRVPQQLWLPAPLASDGFGAWGNTDGLGHAEGVVGGIGAGGSGKVWTAQLGTWGVAAGKAAASALDGGTSQAIATLDAGTPNAHVACDLTRAAGALGVMLRYVDADNHIRASHDGTNMMLIKRVGGTDTTVISAAATYAAGARGVVIADAASFQLFYNNLKVGATSTISDAALQTSSLCGIRTTDTGNTFDNFTVRGVAEGQYSTLDQWVQP